jgi:hydroxyacylglutathione hydrolase
MSFTIELLPAFADNYIFLVSDSDLGLAMVVDPGDGDVVIRALKQRDLHLSLILNTHHHADHIGGNDKLQREYGAPIIGPAAERTRIAGMGRAVAQGDIVTFSTLRGEVLATHGHTAGHISFYFPQIKALFCGDALFSLGCGKVFEGTPAQMWDSLKRLRALSDDTQIFCAHEYSESNAKFALAIDKNNENLKARAAQIATLRRDKQPTIPALLGSEKLCNPFLRADQSDLRRVLAKAGLAAEDADPAAVFGMLRSAKDHFGGQKL